LKNVNQLEIETATLGQRKAIDARLVVLFDQLRSTIERVLVTIANRELPLLDREWVWEEVKGSDPCWRLVTTPRGKRKEGAKIQGQRGLSMDRIEQIENLRKRFMSLNRAMTLKMKDEARQGRQDTGRRIHEPCQEMLDKLDRIKQQRINQTAHMILAQALGLRLRLPQGSKEERQAADIHGEYEVIPGRRVADGIIM
jgi:hypothetical protein